MASAPAPAIKATAKSLDELEWPEDPADLGKFFGSLSNALMDQLYDLYDQTVAERGEFLAKEGVAGVLLEDQRAHEGLLFAEAAGGFKAASTPAPPTFVVTAEQYNRIARLVDKKSPARVRLNLKAATSAGDVDGENIVGEIPGGAKKDEIVMVGAHFDSWASGTGATDNGAGSAVMIEVMRILKTLNLKLDRTVRIGFVGWRRRGPLRSRAYVKQHFATPRPCRSPPSTANSPAISTWTMALAKFAACTCKAMKPCGRSSSRGSLLSGTWGRQRFRSATPAAPII